MKKALYILAIAVMAAACSKGSRVNPDSAAVGGYSTYNSSPVGQYMMSIADDLIAGASEEVAAELSTCDTHSEVTDREHEGHGLLLAASRE